MRMVGSSPQALPPTSCVQSQPWGKACLSRGPGTHPFGAAWCPKEAWLWAQPFWRLTRILGLESYL